MDAEDALFAVAGCAMAVVADKNGSSTRSTGAQTGAIGKSLVCEEERHVVVLMFCPLIEKVMLGLQKQWY
jgi:hypothetical protein